MIKYALVWLPSKNFLFAFFFVNLAINSSLLLLQLVDGILTSVLYLLALPTILLIGPLLTRFTESTLAMAQMPFFDQSMIRLLVLGYVCIVPFFLFDVSAMTFVSLQWQQYLLVAGQYGIVFLFVINSAFHFVPILWKLSKGRLYSVGYGENTYHWLQGVWISVSFVWLTLVVDVLSDLFDYHPAWRDVISNSIHFCMFFGLAFFTVRYCKQPGQDEEREHCKAQAKYEKSGLTAEHAEQILKKVDLLMHEQTLFLDSTISVDKLATLSSTQPQYLSQAINQFKQMNFYEFIANYRIEFAKEELRSNPSKSVIDVAMTSGFNAKSTFNNTFKKLTGVTPSQYKKQHVK